MTSALILVVPKVFATIAAPDHFGFLITTEAMVAALPKKNPGPGRDMPRAAAVHDCRLRGD